MLHVEKFDYNSYDDLASNTYVVYDDNAKAVVIDPSVDYDGIIRYLNKHNLNLKAILITHGHFDHFQGLARLTKDSDIPVYIHQEDLELLTNPRLNCSYFEDKEITYSKEVKTVVDNELIKIFQEDDIKVIHTPYHTKGSVCYYLKNNNLLFSGDSLFKLSIGNSALPTSYPQCMDSSLEKLKKLPKITKVMPGHGANTTIEFELSFNRFLNN